MTSKQEKYQKTREQYEKVLVVVREKWPNIFHHFKRKPLMHRISLELINKTEFSKEEIYSFLAIWCSDYHYQQNLMFALNRFNLENKAVGVVTWEERAQACERYHNFLMKRQNNSEGIKPPCTIFTKPNMALEMYNHFSAYLLSHKDTQPEHFFSVDEINFMIANYKGDRNESEFKLITTAYLRINKDGETIKRPSHETKHS